MAMQDERDHCEATPLGRPDPTDVSAFWARSLEVDGGDPETPLPEVGAFGDSIELADELVDLVIAGEKQATAGAVAEYVATGEPFPKVGERWIVTDGSMRPRAVLETTEVRVGPLSSIDDEFASDVGEGDRTRESWLESHTWYFSKTLARIDVEFHPEIPVVFERFQVHYSED